MPKEVKGNDVNVNNSSVASITVGNVNTQDILVIQNNEEKRVPIRPICEALGVDFSSQLKKLKDDPIFGSVVVTVTTTGRDGKSYEMQTLPHKFIFGWIFKIDSRNVKKESRAALIKYQLECNEVLYSYFELRHRYIEERQFDIEESRDIIQMLNESLVLNQAQLKEARAQLKKVREKDFDSWLEEQRQMKIDFTEKEVGNE